jgi:hypothetical protein
MKSVLFSLLFSFLATSTFLSGSVCVADVTMGSWNGAQTMADNDLEMEMIFNSRECVEFNEAFGVAGGDYLADTIAFSRSNEIFGINTQMPPMPSFAATDANGLDSLAELDEVTDSNDDSNTDDSNSETVNLQEDELAVAAIPEPAIAVVMIGLGMAAFACVRRRRFV